MPRSPRLVSHSICFSKRSGDTGDAIRIVAGIYRVVHQHHRVAGRAAGPQHTLGPDGQWPQFGHPDRDPEHDEGDYHRDPADDQGRKRGSRT